jgi:ABC-type uncharacterized transport system YnjBCD permease subunit
MAGIEFDAKSIRFAWHPTSVPSLKFNVETIALMKTIVLFFHYVVLVWKHGGFPIPVLIPQLPKPMQERNMRFGRQH